MPAFIPLLVTVGVGAGLGAVAGVTGAFAYAGTIGFFAGAAGIVASPAVGRHQTRKAER